MSISAPKVNQTIRWRGCGEKYGQVTLALREFAEVERDRGGKD